MTETPQTRLQRPLQGRRISGVCAAIAQQQRIDLRIVRVVTLVLMVVGGVGFIAYLAGVLLIPAEGQQEPIIRTGIDGPERTTVILLAIAALIVVAGLGVAPFGMFGHGWPVLPLLLVLAVALYVIKDDDPGGRVAAVAGSAAVPPPAEAPVIPGDEAPTVVMPAGPPAPQPRPRTHAALVLGGALLALGITGGVLAAAGSSVRWDVALCAVVIAVGAGLVISAPLGGARALIPLGLLLALAAGGVAAADLSLRGGVGDHLHRPASLAPGRTDYDLAAGRLMVDLRDVTLLPGSRTTVHAEVGFGQVVVRLPRGVQIDARGHASAGDVDMLGNDSNGFDARDAQIITAAPGGPVLRVDAKAGFGQVRILRAGQDLPPLGDHSQITTGATR